MQLKEVNKCFNCGYEEEYSQKHLYCPICKTKFNRIVKVIRR
jgi:Zn finger protein HypA/HybF involved in hydrogenase expression